MGQKLRMSFAVAAVLAVGLGIRLWMNVDVVGPDSLVYAQHASELARGELQLGGSDQYLHRVPVYLVTALLYRFFGPSPLTTALWPILLSTMQIALVIAVARRFVGPGFAWLGGAFLALIPLDVICSVRLMPDIVQGVTTTAAVGFWILACGRSGRMAWLGAFAAGLSLAAATATRPYALLAVVPMAAWMWVERPSRGVLLASALGFALPVLSLVVSYGIATGDPLYRWHVVVSNYGQRLAAETRPPLFYLRIMAAPMGWLGPVGPLFLVSFVYLLLARRRRLAVLALWSAVFLIFLSVGSMSLSEYKPIFKRARFLTPVMPVMAISCAVFLHAIAQRGARLIESRTRMVVFLVACGFCTIPLHAWRTLRVERETRSAQNHAATTVAASLRGSSCDFLVFDHWRTALRFQYLLGFPFEPSVYVGADDAVRMQHSPGAGANFGYLLADSGTRNGGSQCVVLDEDLLERWERGDEHPFDDADRPPALALSPPADWQLVASEGPYRVYRTGAAAR